MVSAFAARLFHHYLSLFKDGLKNTSTLSAAADASQSRMSVEHPWV